MERWSVKSWLVQNLRSPSTGQQGDNMEVRKSGCKVEEGKKKIHNILEHEIQPEHYSDPWI